MIFGPMGQSCTSELQLQLKKWIVVWKWIVGKNLGWSANYWPSQPKFCPTQFTFGLQFTFSSNSLVHDPGLYLIIFPPLYFRSFVLSKRFYGHGRCQTQLNSIDIIGNGNGSLSTTKCTFFDSNLTWTCSKNSRSI